jgi:outer membrane protein assembly factor BamB
VQRLLLGFAALAALASSACGARSAMELAATSGAPDDDACPSAVAGPAPMFRACSTRDGRARVDAPRAPHVTWTLPPPASTAGYTWWNSLATDDRGNAYVLGGEDAPYGGALRKVRADGGTLLWSAPLVPSDLGSTPVVHAGGPVEVFAYDAAQQRSVFQLDPATGAAQATTFGLDLYNGASDPAVGADGSLYLVHSADVGTADTRTFVSRVRPDGTVAWTSVDLTTLLALPPETTFAPQPLALGPGDLVLLALWLAVVPGEQTAVLALDAASGALRWSVPIADQILGGPTVRADGSIAILAGPLDASSLHVLDPASGADTVHALSAAVIDILAVTRSGGLITGTDVGDGVTGITALDADGAVLWAHDGPSRATLAADGRVVAFGAGIEALDPDTGVAGFTLAPPVPSSCLVDVALTSDGQLVGLHCDGTLFGASD